MVLSFSIYIFLYNFSKAATFIFITQNNWAHFATFFIFLGFPNYSQLLEDCGLLQTTADSFHCEKFITAYFIFWPIICQYSDFPSFRLLATLRMIMYLVQAFSVTLLNNLHYAAAILLATVFAFSKCPHLTGFTFLN